MISIEEAATGTPGARTESYFVPMEDDSFPQPGAPAFPPYAAARNQRHTAPARRFSTRSIQAALAVVIIVEAIAIIAVLFRDRAPRNAERPRGSTTSAIDPGRAATRATVAPASAARTPVAAPAEPAAQRQPTPEAAAPAPTTGRLVVRSDPTGAQIAIDGRGRGKTPLALDGLTAGSHRIQLGTADASVEQVVTIEAGTTITLVVPMNAAGPTTGWLSLIASIPLQIFEKGKLLGTTADGPVRVGTGTHRLELVNEPLGYRGEARVRVGAGEIVRVRPQIPEGMLNVNAQPWATVWVDGEPAGETPLGNIKVTLGRHEIRFRHPTLGEQVRQVIVSAREPARVSVSMKP